MSTDKFQKVVNWCREWIQNWESDISRHWFENITRAIVNVKNIMSESDEQQKELEIDLRELVKYWEKFVVSIFEEMIEIVNKEFNLFSMKWDTDTIKDIEKLKENRKLLDFLDTFEDNKFFISIYLD